MLFVAEAALDFWRLVPLQPPVSNWRHALEVLLGGSSIGVASGEVTFSRSITSDSAYRADGKALHAGDWDSSGSLKLEVARTRTEIRTGSYHTGW